MNHEPWCTTPCTCGVGPTVTPRIDNDMTTRFIEEHTFTTQEDRTVIIDDPLAREATYTPTITLNIDEEWLTENERNGRLIAERMVQNLQDHRNATALANRLRMENQIETMLQYLEEMYQLLKALYSRERCAAPHRELLNEVHDFLVNLRNEQ